MLHFLRRIRRNLINSGSLGKYTLYAAGEIALVVIGILIALQINNWNENRVRNRVEIDILKGCLMELTADLTDINLNIEELKKSHQALNLIIEVLENDRPYHDSLNYHFNYTLLPIHFVHSTSSFEMLKSKGLDIVSNPDLRAKLILLYDSQYDFFLKAESEELAEVQYGMRYILSGRFKSGWNYPEYTFEGNMIPLDFEALKTDQDYLYFIKTQQNRTISYIGFFYANLKKSVESMIQDLEIEINRFEP
jgi:hypothetical protein